MTTHYADFDGGELGLVFSSVTLWELLPALTTETAVATASATVEHDPGSGVYRATFANVAAGTYRLRAIVGGTLRAQWIVEFAGTDGEIVGVIYTSGLATQESVDALPAAIWDHLTSALTTVGSIGKWLLDNVVGSPVVSVPASTAADALVGNLLTVHRGDTFQQQYTGLGDISNRTKLWVTVKQAKSQADSEALFQITESGGLLTFNGAAADNSALASLVVDDGAAGDVTITIDETLSAQLREVLGWHWDVQVLRSTGAVTTLVQSGVFNATEDVTRATS